MILGIDPGYGRMGWGVVQKLGNAITPVSYGCLETDPKASRAERLHDIQHQLEHVMDHFKPVAVGIEELFFQNNQKTAMKVAEARGVALVTAVHDAAEIFEFTPQQIKQSLTGYGSADKGQMQRMIKLLLGFKTIPKPDDAADALAIALVTARVYKG